MDGTGVTTVRKPNRIIGRRGTKQLGAITSASEAHLLLLQTQDQQVEILFLLHVTLFSPE